MPEPPEWVTKLVEQQQSMNRVTFEQLQGAGLKRRSKVRLDFAYFAPDEPAAQRLAAGLRERTDYDVNAPSQSVDADELPWSVQGRTKPTVVDIAKLDQWVDWMVEAGWALGPAVFDGWGAQV